MPNDAAPAADASPSNFRSAISAQAAAPAAQPSAPAPAQSAPAPQPVRPPLAAVPNAPAAQSAALADPNSGQPWPVPGAEPAADPVAQQLATEGQLTPEQIAAQMQQPGQQQAQPGALERLYHGVSGADILAAIERGELPEQLFAAVGGTFRLDDQDVRGTLQEWKEGGMRHARFTRGMMENARVRNELNDLKQRVTGLFNDWDKPEGFAAGVEQHGLVDNVHAYVTRDWGSEQQPNVQGFIESMHRLGGYATFQRAAQAYMQQYQQLFETFGGGVGDPNDPAVQQRDQRAHQMTEQYIADHRQTAKERAEAAREKLAAKSMRSKLERDALLRVDQQQQTVSTVDQQRVQGEIRGALERLGVNAYDRTKPGHIPDAQIFMDQNLRNYYQLAKSGQLGEITQAQVIGHAAAATLDELRIRGLIKGNAPAPQQHQQQHQQQVAPQQLQHLPAQRTVAPVTLPGVGQIPVEGAPAEFRTRINAFRGMRPQPR